MQITMPKEISSRTRKGYSVNMKREIKSLLIASEHVKADRFLILTYDQEEILKAPGIEAEVLPVWKWTLIFS